MTPGSLLANLIGAAEVGVNSTHHQAVGTVAKALQATAITADGVIEAVELKDPSQLPFLLAVQFHPERLFDRFEAFLRIFTGFTQACKAGMPKKSRQ